jgi:cardiolipin synthase (CMP-forming)
VRGGQPVVTLVSMAGWCNLANLFTLIRLLLTPFALWAILTGRHALALALFFLAAITDVLDGFAARRLARVTQSGAYFDPIADKILLSGAFLAFAAAHIAPWWFVAIVLGRDVYILLGVLMLLTATPIRRFPPSVWGKASTFVQILTVGCWLTRDAFPGPALDAIGEGILWPCTAATVWSGLHYTWRGVRLAREKRQIEIDAPPEGE